MAGDQVPLTVNTPAVDPPQQADPGALPVVYAITNATPGQRAGGIARVVQGQHWYEHDQIVRDNPHLFSRDPRWGMQFTEMPAGYDPDGSSMVATLAGEVPQVLHGGQVAAAAAHPVRGHRAAAGGRRAV